MCSMGFNFDHPETLLEGRKPRETKRKKKKETIMHEVLLPSVPTVEIFVWPIVQSYICYTLLGEVLLPRVHTTSQQTHGRMKINYVRFYNS